MDIRTMIYKVGGRKLVVGMILLILATVMLFMDVGGITFEKWASFSKWTFAVMTAGNVFSKIVVRFGFTAHSEVNSEK